MPQIVTRKLLFPAAVLSGLLLSLSWPSAGFAPLIFVALVPLLLMEDFVLRHPEQCKRGRHFWFAYIGFLLFNVLTTWWVKYASFFGAVAAISCNALFMALVFQLFHATRRRLGNTAGYLSLPVYWIAFEHVHMDWDLSWPWLTLGNVFAGWPRMIQWYEFTGVLGGTLWVLVVNMMVAVLIGRWVKEKQEEQGKQKVKGRKEVVFVILLVFVPVLYSMVRYETYEESSKPVSVAVIQPNIDPYNEKFSGMSAETQLKRILSLAEKATDSNTRFVVAPETALPEGIWEEQLDIHPHVEALKEFQLRHPGVTWVIGLSSNRFYPDSNLRSATARKFTQANGYYDSYNTAMQLESSGTIQLHHKSKLVPGVEKMPFPAIFKHIEGFAIDLGGISGSLGTQDMPTVFSDSATGLKSAPVICYESIYGDYLASYVRRGAELIFIITNDGWWSDTPGYRQHFKYATLRAIEMRRSIARSANTGISCFINQRGDILQATRWWEPAAIKAVIQANDTLTFYARFGDYLGTLALFGVFVFPLWRLLARRKK